MRSVLIVDDDEDIIDSLRLALEGEGLEVHTARNGQEALLMLTHGALNPQLMLLDLMMPVMNGAELLANLRSDPTWLTLPIIAMSAHSSVEVKGAQALLRKPFDLSVLLKLIEQHLT